MIKLNNKRLCENCFAEVTSDTCGVCGYSKKTAALDPTVLPSGSILMGRYVVGHVIGKGGFGITYLAYDIKMEKVIAIKEFYPFGLALRMTGSPTVSVSSSENASVFQDGAEKFYNEARLVSRFNGNPNIVSVYEFFYENDTVYFTMEYLKGQTLKSYVKEHGVLTSGQAVFIAENVSNALMAAHSSNVLHRDISPDNIMLCSNGTVKLIDFGAARQVMAEGSQSLSVILKPGFAPLEQYQKKGKQGPWTDIYSLGATLYYAMTLDTLDDPMTRMEGDEEYLSNPHNIDEGLWEIIEKSTMLRIPERYADIFEFRKALGRLNIVPEPVVTASEEEKAEPAADFHTAQPVGTLSGVTASGAGKSQAPAYADGDKTVFIGDGSEEAAAKAPHGKKTKTVIAAVSAAVAVVGIAAGVIALSVVNRDDKDISDSNGVTATASSLNRADNADNSVSKASANGYGVQIIDPDGYFSNEDNLSLIDSAEALIDKQDCNVLVSMKYINAKVGKKEATSPDIYYDYFSEKSDGVAIIACEYKNGTSVTVRRFGDVFENYSEELTGIELDISDMLNDGRSAASAIKKALNNLKDIEKYEGSTATLAPDHNMIVDPRPSNADEVSATTTVTATTAPEVTTTAKATTTTTKATTAPEVTTTAKATTTTKATTVPEVTTTAKATTTTKATAAAAPEEPASVKIGGKSYSTDVYGLELNGLGLKDSDIENLKYMKNLTYINLCDNNLKDVSVLGSIPTLQNIQLHNNNISDISFVKKLNDLDCLAAQNNNISDLSPLKGNTKIAQIWLAENPITDISALSGLTNMTAMGFNWCQLKSLSPLKNMTKLETLCLEGTGVSDLSPLKNCKKLKYLYLGSCNVTDVSPLAGVEGFVELYLNDNPISENSIQSFKGMTIAKSGYINLERTDLTESQLQKILDLLFETNPEFYYNYS